VGLFKKPVVVKCYNKEELGKLVNWLRRNEGLAALNRQRYSVTAVMAMQYWDNPNEVLYFEVSVPYYEYKKIRERFIRNEAFDSILEARAFDEILGRLP
jgi:hypothetical protein